MSFTPLPIRQAGILYHSLGLNHRGEGNMYRNRYITGPGSNCFDDCLALCAAGLMKDYGHQEMMGGNHFFSVTEAGISWVCSTRPPKPKLTRSQKRYREFLESDCGASFGEWLKFRKVTT